MKAIQFDFTYPRYILGLGLGQITSSIFWSGMSCTQYKEIPEPELPGDDWVVVKTRLGGICGTDMSAVKLNASTYSSALLSFPFVIGHENIGRIAKVGSNAGKWVIGDRVVVEPLLWCNPRGIDQFCPHCASGEINHCTNITKGSISPGISQGLCHDTGGSWAPYFVAHKDQLYQVPDKISDENGMMIEPFVIGLHAALQNLPEDHEQVLIIGAGSIGLCMLAALRALDTKSEIIVAARYGFQAEAARTLGADYVIEGSGISTLYEEIARLSNAEIMHPIMGKPLVMGGVDRVFECVGSRSSLDDAMRLTGNGGKVVFLGEPGLVKSLDWTPIFTQDLSVKAAYLYNHNELYEDRIWKTFELAIHLMENEGLDLGWLITHKFRLNDYKKAFSAGDRKKQEQAIKVVFEFPE